MRQKKHIVRSGIRNFASIRRPERPLALSAGKVINLESGALDRSAILTTGYDSYSLTNRFQVAVRQFNNRLQVTSKCARNEKVAHEALPSVSLMFLPYFDVFCDVLVNKRTTTSKLFVSYNNEKPYFHFKIIQHNSNAGFCHPPPPPGFAHFGEYLTKELRLVKKITPL